MSLLQKVLTVGLVVAALVMLIRGQPLVRGPRRWPADPPWLTRSHGLGLLLGVASTVARSRVLGGVLAGAALLVLLVPRIVASRQGRI